jgi:hypothetical protein
LTGKEKAKDEKKTELWKAFHDKSLFGSAFDEAMAKRQRFANVRLFYDTDTVFRREIDGLKKKMERTNMGLEKADAQVEEYLKEAEYRRYIATFENMRLNYDARKKEMDKLKDAFK